MLSGAAYRACGLHNPEGKLIARAEKPDGSALYEFEITGFELIGPGEIHR